VGKVLSDFITLKLVSMKINDQLSVLFLLEKSRPSKEGLLPVTVRITLEGVRAEFMLGKYVLPQFWNKEANRLITKNHPDPTEARSINNAIINCLAKLPNDLDWLNNEYSLVTADMLKQAYL
jgi:hypothetical protein